MVLARRVPALTLGTAPGLGLKLCKAYKLQALERLRFNRIKEHVFAKSKPWSTQPPKDTVPVP